MLTHLSRRGGRLLLAGLAALSVHGCSGGTRDPNEAFRAAETASDSDTRLEHYESAKQGYEEIVHNADAGETKKFRARRNLVVCEAHVNGDAAAADAFKKLVSEYKNKLDINGLAKLGRDLGDAGCLNTAMDVITAADGMAKTEAEKAPLDSLVELIKASGDEDALAELRALGYVN